jgi:hypothetical protein
MKEEYEYIRNLYNDGDKLKEAMQIIDEYLNAGFKDKRKEVHNKAKALYEKHYGIKYVNINDRINK